MAAAPSTPAPAAAVPAPAPTQPRVIPGFKPAATAEAKKARSRPKKTPKGPSDVAGAVAADGVATTETAPTADALSTPLIAQVESEEEVIEEKKTAVEAVQKRLRAANKKIQRIVTYEEKTEALNQDQQKAIATKPALEATVKELQELLVILKAEEADEDRRQTVLKARDEKRHGREIEVAVAAGKAEIQADLVLLFQFIHLHGLYTPSEQSFAPPVLPSVVANATGQEVAGVKSLYYHFANGPLLGGHSDAIEKLSKLAAGSDETVLPNVTFGRIKELIAGLTSLPEELTLSAAPVDPTPEAAALHPSDSTVSLLDGAAPEPTPSFLQASELAEDVPVSADDKVTSWADEVTEAEESSTPTPVVEATPTPAPAAFGWGVPAAPHANGAPALAPVAPQAQQPLDWSDDHSGLPSLEGLTPHAAAPVVAEAAPAVESDGFTAARNSRRGGPPSIGGERGGRGGHRGGEGRGRGGYRGRGGPREGGAPREPREGDAPREHRERREPREGGAPAEGSWTRAPRAQGGERGSYGGGESRGRGGRGRGEGRGRGGERRGPSNAPASNGAPAPVAAAPAAAPAA